MNVTIQVVDGKIKLCSATGEITELSRDQLLSLDIDIFAAMHELEEMENG